MCPLGIEPKLIDWKCIILPLNYERLWVSPVMYFYFYLRPRVVRRPRILRRRVVRLPFLCFRVRLPLPESGRGVVDRDGTGVVSGVVGGVSTRRAPGLPVSFLSLSSALNLCNAACTRDFFPETTSLSALSLDSASALSSAVFGAAISLREDVETMLSVEPVDS